MKTVRRVWDKPEEKNTVSQVYTDWKNEYIVWDNPERRKTQFRKLTHSVFINKIRTSKCCWVYCRVLPEGQIPPISASLVGALV